MEPIAVKTDEQGGQGARMERNVECEGIHFTIPVEEPGDKNEMGGTADRKEFRDPLHNAQYNCFKQELTDLRQLSVNAGYSIHQVPSTNTVKETLLYST
jgi:hypothetical protein